MRWVWSAVAVTLAIVAGFLVTRPVVEPSAIAGTVAEYPSMTALRTVEQAGVAYDLTWTITGSPLIVVAPHGGSIELRTSEIATAIAGAEHTLCRFEGRLPAGQNARLHVTSEHWDTEECLILIAQRTHALSVHGTSKAGQVVHIGGRDTATGAELAAALRAAGFTVVQPATGDVAGTSTANFVNRDADGAGVQLELTADLRTELFPAKGGPAAPRGQAFVDAVRAVYAG